MLFLNWKISKDPRNFEICSHPDTLRRSWAIYQKELIEYPTIVIYFFNWRGNIMAEDNKLKVFNKNDC